MVQLAAALAGVYLMLLLLPGATRAAAAATNVSFVVFPGLAAIACWTGARRRKVEQRRTWRLLTLAMAMYAGGGLVWLAYALQGVPVPVPSLGEAGFLGYVVPLTAALLLVPIATQTRIARAEILLDCAVIFGSVLLCVWVLVLERLGPLTAGRSAPQVLTLYAYPVADVLVIAAALATLVRVRSRDVQAWLSLVGGLVVVAAADLVYVTVVAGRAYDPGALYNILWAVAFLLVATAPLFGDLERPAGQRLTTARALVPYGALTCAVGVALSNTVVLQESPALFVLALALCTTAAVRQILVVVVKNRLADHLEQQVAAATAGLRDEREFLGAVVDSLHAGIVACDRRGRMTLYNQANAQLHSDPGSTRADHWHTDLRSADGTAVLAPEDTPLMQALAGDRVEDVEFMINPPHAPAVAVTASGRALRDADGGVIGAVVAVHDVTAQRRQRHALERRASHDELTGLGNRAAFTAEVDRRVASDLPVAVLLLDLDDFKHINDSLGHDTGDRCLVGTGRRLVQALPPGGVAFRLGGDEFVIVIDPQAVVPERCARDLLRAVSVPVHEAGQELSTTASIGVALRGPECSTARELLQAADLAMYVAKSAGKAGLAVYQGHMRREAQARLAVEADLRAAISAGALTLQYQPIVDLSSGRMTAAETLVRWNHPTRGAISPVHFIPIAERCGLIAPLGEWVLRQACAQLLRWDALGGDRSFRITVNVSTRQLERGGLLGVLDECLNAGVDPSRLLLEVTETALTLDSIAALQTMQAIRARGVHLAVDDFGTGYSSLSRLRAAPVSRVKIDRTFICEITDTDAHVPIVDATIAMARGLGMGVIAEGIETSEQLTHLIGSGCPEAQGFLLSEPVDAASLLACMTAPPPWAQYFP